MTFSRTCRFFVPASCAAAALGLIAACATERAVPLERAVELPVFIPEGEPHIIVGPVLRDVPREGTWETTKAPRPTSASQGVREFFKSDPTGLSLPFLIAADIGDGVTQREQERLRTTYLKKTKPLWDLLSYEVTRHLDEALVDAFKASLRWTSPNLTTEPEWRGEFDGPTVAIPALELRLSTIQFIVNDPDAQTGTLVICARTAVIGGSKYRAFETCRHETWESAGLSTVEDREPFIARLTAASARLGVAMAKGVITK